MLIDQILDFKTRPEMDPVELLISAIFYQIIFHHLNKSNICDYCATMFNDFTSFLCHLEGVIEGNVAPCSCVPPDVRTILRTHLVKKYTDRIKQEEANLYRQKKAAEKLSSKKGKRACKGRVGEIPNTGGGRYLSNFRAVKIPFTGAGENPLAWEAKKFIGRLFYELGLDFDAINSPSFCGLLTNFLASGCIYNSVPSSDELKGSILQDIVQEIRAHVKDISNSWASSGCSIILDGWTDVKGRNLVNVLVHCTQGTVYLYSCDISACIGNIDAMLIFCGEIINLVGVNNVIQIVTNSVSPFMNSVGKCLMDKYRSVFWSVGVSCCLDLMLKEVGKSNKFATTIRDVKQILRFIYNNDGVLKLFLEYTGGQQLVKPSKAGSVVLYTTLQNMVAMQEILVKFFLSLDERIQTLDWKRVANVVGNGKFWGKVKAIATGVAPIINSLKLMYSSDEPKMGFIYETIDQMKETIREQLRKKKYYKPFWKAIDDIWNAHLYAPIHAAGYFLNPSLFYSSQFFIDPEVVSGLCCSIVRSTDDVKIQDSISLQLEPYRKAQDGFARGSTAQERSNVPPLVWWAKYGGQCPQLQRFAIRTLSQTCDDAGKYELRKSFTEAFLSDDGWNTNEHQRIRDLAFVHFNLQLQKFASSGNHTIVPDEIESTGDSIADAVQDVIRP